MSWSASVILLLSSTWLSAQNENLHENRFPANDSREGWGKLLMLTTFLIRKVQHYRLTAVVMIIRWHCRPGVQFQAEGAYNHMLPAIPYSYSLRLHTFYPTFLFLQPQWHPRNSRRLPATTLPRFVDWTRSFETSR